ncbi:hypothetical protein CGLO_17892 [Colletotrichum gloeosporioides Cg-14]|nr:hypothetical protein CGLO_17892 [Colletotrichum gloeosporioides Cg-14]
MLPFSPI